MSKAKRPAREPMEAPPRRIFQLDFARAKRVMQRIGLLGDGLMETIVAEELARHREVVLELADKQLREE